MDGLVLDENGIWTDRATENVSYPTEASDALFEIEDKSFWFRHRNMSIKKVIDRFPFKNNFSDIGGGNGFQARFIEEHFKNASVYLLEPYYSGCLNAKKRGLTHIYNVPFQKFDFSARKVDGVGLFDVIEHIKDDADFLLQLKALLPQGSYIYFTVPAHQYLWSDTDDYGGHYRRYNLSMIRALAKKVGVQMVYASYLFSYVPPITYFLKHIPYKIRGKQKDADILNSETQNLSPSGIIPKIFDLFHRRELKALERGSVSYGGSCIGVYRT